MGFIEHLAPRRLSGRASGIPMYAPISLNGGIAHSPAAIEWPRQRNPGVQSEIIHVSVGLFAIRQVDFGRRKRHCSDRTNRMIMLKSKFFSKMKCLKKASESPYEPSRYV